MIGFLVASVLLGVGLAMDAFSVSLANGMNGPEMSKGKESLIAGTFGFFQGLMPMIGWVCVHTLIGFITAFEKLVPWIALILLALIGGKMIREGICQNREEKAGLLDEEARAEATGRTGPGGGTLFLQGIATSIDALSVGFAIAHYTLGQACLCALIIAAVTFIISAVGLALGKRLGMKLAGKASILGGVILVIIGLEICISNLV